MYCKKCGAEIPDDSSFCFKCGTKISEEIKNSTNHSEKKEMPMTGNNSVPSPSSSHVDSTHESKSVSGNNAQSSPVAPSSQGQKGINVKKIVIIAAAVIVVIIILANLIGDNKSDKTGSDNNGITAGEGNTDNELDFISNCKSIKYEELARYDTKYKGEKIKEELKVAQVISSGGTTYYRCYAKDGGDFLFSSKEWYVKDARKNKDSNIIEDDIVTMYGTFTGLTTITRAINNTDASVLGMDAKYILFKGESVDVSNAELVSEAELLSAIIANPLSMSNGNSKTYPLNFSNASISNFAYDNPNYTESGGLKYNVEFSYSAKHASVNVLAQVSFIGANGSWELSSVQYTDILFSSIDANGKYKYDDYNGVKELNIYDFNNSTLTGTLEDRYGTSPATVEYGVDYGIGYLYIKGDYFSERFNIETGEFNNYKRVSGGSSSSTNNSNSYDTSSTSNDVTNQTKSSSTDSYYDENKYLIGDWKSEYNDDWVSVELYENVNNDGYCGHVKGVVSGMEIDSFLTSGEYDEFTFSAPYFGDITTWWLYGMSEDRLILSFEEYMDHYEFVR